MSVHARGLARAWGPPGWARFWIGLFCFRAAVVLPFALPVYYGMFCWLFELGFVEALWATYFIGLVQRVVSTVLTLALAGVFMKMAANGP